MTKSPAIKTNVLDKYTQLDLHQLEEVITKLQQTLPTPENKTNLRAARQALRQRLRFIKSSAMKFEQTNDHHLLLFDSTDNFAKIAGHSVLYYTLTIADRIHRRYSVKNDSDEYYRSEEGIVSIRSLESLEVQLAEIDIYPDRALSTNELHFYKLPRTYTDEQIAKLRDKSEQDVERITSIIIPVSPIPELYTLILELNRLIYYNCKRISDTLARDTLLQALVLDANEILVSYLNLANAKESTGVARKPTQNFTYLTNTKTHPTSAQAQNLYNILLYARNLRNNLANIENLHLLHHRELCNILEKLVETERVAAREYNKQLRKDREKTAPNDKL